MQLSTNDSDGYIQVDEDDYEAIAGKISYENTDEEDDYSDYDLVIAMISDAGLQFDIYDLAEQCGLKVKVIKYDEYSYLDIKLMAHDSDVDLFYTASLDMFKYIRDGYYVNLNEYDSLKTRLDSNNYTKAACSYDGEYFGVSMHPFYSDYTQTEWSNTHYKYMCKNIDSMKELYSDPDGEELYEVLKHHYNHPNDEQENAYYSEIYNVIIDEYLVISPFFLKKENAVKFLEGTFDVVNGDLRLFDAKAILSICIICTLILTSLKINTFSGTLTINP